MGDNLTTRRAQAGVCVICYMMFTMHNGVYCLSKTQLFTVNCMICQVIQLVPTLQEGGVCDTQCAMPQQILEQVIHDYKRGKVVIIQNSNDWTLMLIMNDYQWYMCAAQLWTIDH
jgi:hypothetical protein